VKTFYNYGHSRAYRRESERGGGGLEPGPLKIVHTLWMAVKGYLVHGEGPRPVAGVESAAAWKGRACAVLPTLCRTFRPIQKNNSATEEKIRSPINFAFLKEFVIKKKNYFGHV
jgi:hypothetical protein